jgi:hypothetical protein
MVRVIQQKIKYVKITRKLVCIFLCRRFPAYTTLPSKRRVRGGGGFYLKYLHPTECGPWPVEGPVNKKQTKTQNKNKNNKGGVTGGVLFTRSPAQYSGY